MADKRNRTPFYGAVSPSKLQADHVFLPDGTPVEDALQDYIVEEGTEGIWTYRKWNSGVAECWGKTSVTSNWALWVSPIYFTSTYTSNISYPTDLFLTTPQIISSVDGTADMWLAIDGAHLGSATQTGKYFAMKVNNSTTITYTVNFYAIGSWK